MVQKLTKEQKTADKRSRQIKKIAEEGINVSGQPTNKQANSIINEAISKGMSRSSVKTLKKAFVPLLFETSRAAKYIRTPRISSAKKKK